MIDPAQPLQTKVPVLVVDDEETFRRNLIRLMNHRNIPTLEAANGAQCLAMLESTPVDVVVLDVQMPGMNGVEVLRRIKAQYERVEVILLTGQANARDGVAGIKAGAFDYLSKPVEIDHLVGKIKQACNKKKMEESHLEEMAFRAAMEKQMVVCERLAALGTLAAGVAHEINNPLSIIKQSVKWLTLRLEKNALTEHPIREEIAKALGNIDTAVARAGRITHQLLASARNHENHLLETDLANLVQDAVALVEREAADKDIALDVRLDPRLKPVRCNPDSLRQVLTNLALNAVHATPKGGRVTIDAQDFGEDGYGFSVADTGIGIPAENLDRIFEPFFTTKPPGAGTGLGLYVTRSILDTLGGSITVESRVGKGSRFAVRLPRKTPPANLSA